MKLPDDMAEEMVQTIRKIARDLPDQCGYVMMFFPYDGERIDGTVLSLSNVPAEHLRVLFSDEQFLDNFWVKEEMA